MQGQQSRVPNQFKNIFREFLIPASALGIALPPRVTLTRAGASSAWLPPGSPHHVQPSHLITYAVLLSAGPRFQTPGPEPESGDRACAASGPPACPGLALASRESLRGCRGQPWVSKRGTSMRLLSGHWSFGPLSHMPVPSSFPTSFWKEAGLVLSRLLACVRPVSPSWGYLLSCSGTYLGTRPPVL